ncbi:MAG: right-handed parallel beta-helix repeat-containing protein [Armatimonadetes bacterium]|nr:right-handed parallel beta-helix repeat-containing protein [Armatimonadota bacterium]
MSSVRLGIVVGIVIMAALLVFGVMPAAAATYYVNWDTGDDANDGLSPATAWKNINRGEAAYGGEPAAALVPGDTVEVAAGTYKPGANPYFFYVAGEAGNPITYHANGKVIVDGEYLQGYAPIFLNGSSDYKVFDGFEIIHGKKGAIYSIYCDGVTIKNCVIHDIGQVGAQNVYMVWNEACTGWRYQNNVFYNMTTDWTYAGGIYIYWAGPATEMYNNTFHSTGPTAVLQSTAAVVIFKNNVVSEMHRFYGETD